MLESITSKAAEKHRLLILISSGLAAVLGWGGLSIGTAHAGNGALLTRGAASIDDRVAASSAVREALQQSGWQLSKRQFSDKEAETVAACLRHDKPWSCLAAVIKDPAIEQLAIVSVDPRKASDGAPLTLVTTRIVVASQNLAYGDEQYCERCNTEKVKSAALAVAIKVLSRIYLNSNRSSIDIKSTPTGARVVVDGTVMGASNVIFNILPGRHTVTLSLRGYRTISRSVDVADGQAAEVSVILEPEETPPLAIGVRKDELDEVRILPPWVPPATVGVGVAAILAGGLLLYTGRDQPRGEVQNEYNTSGPGLALLGAGVAVAGAGLYLWWRPPTRSRPPSAASSLSAIPLPHGFAAALTARF